MKYRYEIYVNNRLVTKKTVQASTPNQIIKLSYDYMKKPGYEIHICNEKGLCWKYIIMIQKGKIRARPLQNSKYDSYVLDNVQVQRVMMGNRRIYQNE